MPINVFTLDSPPSYDELVERNPCFFDEAVSAKEAAEIMGTTPGALSMLRHRNIGPSYVRIGKAIRYRRRDLVEYLRASVKPTAAARGVGR